MNNMFYRKCFGKTSERSIWNLHTGGLYVATEYEFFTSMSTKCSDEYRDSMLLRLASGGCKMKERGVLILLLAK